MDTGEIINLLVIGLIAGGLAAAIMGSPWGRRGKKAERWLYYVIVGLLGAVVGQLLFSALDINMPDILSATIEVADIVVAFIGALIVIFLVGFLRR